MFFDWGVFDCNLAHRRSVAALCMMYKIRCSSVLHPVHGALPVPYVPVWVTRGALVSLRYTYAPSSYRASQYRMTFISVSLYLWNDLTIPEFDGVGRRVLRAGSMLLCLILFLAFSSFFLWVGIVGLGSSY